MLQLLKEAKDYIKYKKCAIDNFTFKLHYQFTFALLIVASLLTFANQLVGDKINCMVEHVPNDVMNSYCWIQGTFTIPSQHNEQNVIHSGVSAPTALDNGHNDITIHDMYDKTYHAWYQWVSFILVCQALLFYMPHYLWKAVEGGKLSAIVNGLDGHTIAGNSDMKDDDETKKKKVRREDIAEYLVKSRGTHKPYAWFLAFELMNLAITVLVVYFIDLFLGNEFTLYGIKVLDHYLQPVEQRSDPMSEVFPRITKCTFKGIGTSGTNENWDGMCVLPINMVNELVFILFWFWYLVLMVWTAVHLMIQFIILSSKSCRVKSLIFKCGSLAESDVDKVLNEKLGGSYGDYVLLRQMASIMDPVQFMKIIELVKNVEFSRNNRSINVSVA